jgi:cellobiose phosphorylase
MYRFGLTSLLGFKKTGDSLYIDPVIPPTWDGFDITYRFGATSYKIKVNNPTHIAHNIQLVKLDGKILEPKSIPLGNDGQEHSVEVMMGD